MRTKPVFKGPDWESQFSNLDRYQQEYSLGMCMSQPQNAPVPDGKRKSVLCENLQSSIHGHLRLRKGSASVHSHGLNYQGKQSR